MKSVTLHPIGIVRSPYTSTGDIPKGLGARHDAEGTIEIRPELEAGLDDIEGFSHLYVIWIFDRAGAAELVAYPPSDTRPHGVFATRSPRRPNPLGLSLARIVAVDELAVVVDGIDLLSGTPVLDLKPYVPLFDVPQDEVRAGWFEGRAERVFRRRSDARFTMRSRRTEGRS